MMKLLSAGLFLAGLSSSIVLPQVFIAGGSPVLDANKYPNLVSLQQVGFHYCTGFLKVFKFLTRFLGFLKVFKFLTRFLGSFSHLRLFNF